MTDLNRTTLSFLSAFHDIEHPLDSLESSKDPYIVGTAVILSAHCTDVAVNKVLPGFLARFPTLDSLDLAHKEEAIKLLPGISHNATKYEYIINWATYLKRNVLTSATTNAELTKITGIGTKTASVIMGACFGVSDNFAIDTHCKRVLSRISGEDLSPKACERKMAALYTRTERFDFHMALTQFGRKVCTALNPACVTCPVVDCSSKGLFATK